MNKLLYISLGAALGVYAVKYFPKHFFELYDYLYDSWK